MSLIKYDKKPRTYKLPRPITPEAYLEILFNDLLYDRLHRNDKLTETFGRPIKFLDDLSKDETSRMIEILREQKEGRKKEENGTDESD